MKIQINDDFDMKKIADSGQAFRIRCFDDGTFRFITGNSTVDIKYIHKEENTAACSADIEVSCSEKEWENIWVPYFDISRNYSDIRHRVPESDEFLSRAAASGRGLRILRQDPFETMITFIISQRKNIPAIKSAVETLCRNYGEKISAEREDLYLFPVPEKLAALSEDDLRGCNLGYRAPYVLDAAKKVSEEIIDLEKIDSLSDEDLLEKLKDVKGIGKKVANCIALFAYGRVGLAPIDTWISKVIEQKYDGIDPFPAYGSTAGIMQQYIFYYAQTHKDEF